MVSWLATDRLATARSSPPASVTGPLPSAPGPAQRQPAPVQRGCPDGVGCVELEVAVLYGEAAELEITCGALDERRAGRIEEERMAVAARVTAT